MRTFHFRNELAVTCFNLACLAIPLQIQFGWKCLDMQKKEISFDESIQVLLIGNPASFGLPTLGALGLGFKPACEIEENQQVEK